MLGHNFYHGLIQKYVVLFGTLFNDIKISRFDAEKNKVQTFTVPLNYGPAEHWLSRVEADPKFERPYSELLPRMAYEMVDFSYDGTRKLVTNHKYVGQLAISSGGANAHTAVNMPVPYNIKFRLSILTKTAEDGLKIVEQIAPYFTPDWTVTASLLDDMPGLKLDIPISLESMRQDDQYDAAFEKRRVIQWDLEFTLKGYLFGPTPPAKIIKIARVNIIGNTNEVVDERVTVRPGLTMDGQPTTLESESIPYSEIQATDNYGYIVKIESTPDD